MHHEIPLGSTRWPLLGMARLPSQVQVGNAGCRHRWMQASLMPPAVSFEESPGTHAILYARCHLRSWDPDDMIGDWEHCERAACLSISDGPPPLFFWQVKRRQWHGIWWGADTRHYGPTGSCSGCEYDVPMVFTYNNCLLKKHLALVDFIKWFTVAIIDHIVQIKTTVDWVKRRRLRTYNLFGLRNELVHHLLTPHFFFWFVEWNELIHHHLIPYS
jgi:hypothetical protein